MLTKLTKIKLKYCSDYCIKKNISNVKFANEIQNKLKEKYLRKELLNKIIKYIPKDTCENIVKN